MQNVEIFENSTCGGYRITKHDNGYNVKMLNPTGFPKYKIVQRLTLDELESWKRSRPELKFTGYVKKRLPKYGDPDFPEFLKPGPRRNFVTVWQEGNRRITCSDLEYHLCSKQGKGPWLVDKCLTVEQFKAWNARHPEIVVKVRPPKVW